MKMSSITKAIITSLALVGSVLASPMVIAYYPYWAQYSQFYPKDVRYHLVSTLHYVGFSADSDGKLALIDVADEANFEELVKMAKAKNVKVIATVGGSDNVETLKALASTEEGRSSLASNCVQLVKKYGLDGIELDWIPDDADKGAFASFVATLKGALQAESSSLTLTLVLPGSSSKTSGYDFEAVKTADYLTLQAIDLMDTEAGSTAPNAGTPLVKPLVDFWVSNGISAEKMIPVVPFYARTFADAKGLASSYSGVGSGNDGVLSYRECLEKFEGTDYTVTFDEASQTEVAVSSSETILFSGIPSIKSTANYVKDNQLGGVAAYDISNDHSQPIVSLLVTLNRVLRPDVPIKPKRK